MNLRFWEWDRVYNLVSIAVLLALAGSILVASIEIPVATDADGEPILNTVWDEFGFVGALLLVLLPVLVAAAPLMVLSKKGGIGRQQIINLWLALALFSGYLALFLEFVLVYIPAISFLLSAAVAGTVRRKPTAIGKTAKQESGSGKGGGRRGSGGGLRLSKEARERQRRGKKGR